MSSTPKMMFMGAHIQLPRTSDLLFAVGTVLQPLRNPARQSSDRKHYGKHVGRNADGLEDDARVEVHVRVQVALGEVRIVEGDLFQLHGQIQLRIVDAQFAQNLGQAEHQAEIAYLKSIQKAAKKEQYWRAAAWVLERKNPDDFARRGPNVFTPDQITLILAKFAEIVVNEVPVAAYRKNVLKKLDALIVDLELKLIADVGLERDCICSAVG